MKGYIWMTVLGYVAALLIPLPLLPEKIPDLSLGSPLTSTLEQQPDKPAESITILDAAAGVLYTFNERDFLIYTVAAEMPASFHAEALKAQAVATYTYYLREKEQNADNAALQGAHSSQVPTSFPDAYSPEGLKAVWGDGYDANLRAVAGAVDSVFGKKLTYDGKPILAVYHSENGGRTETAGVVWGTDYPYLQSVASTGDDTGARTVTVSEADFAAAFKDQQLTGDAASWIAGETTVSPAGTVTAITIGGKVFTGREVREKLKLRSACFTVTHENGGFTFAVKGYGHGVGMSQVGANAMAKQGFSYKEILEHYYTGVTVE